MNVTFNKPLVLGTEQELLNQVITSGQFSANGEYTRKCHQILEKELSYRKALLTTSCTSALELAALLLNIGRGDEVIISSYAFVTTANAFATRGAKIVFADSREDNPNINESQLSGLITSKTKAIVALHYGGVACNMNEILAIARKNNIAVIEDNAQGIGSTYHGSPLGGIGDLGAISFHETKNVHCGEGGALLVNNQSLINKANVAWDMGTNKADYKAGKVDSYEWVATGSSYYPSELNAAFLFTQLEKLSNVNEQRLNLWNQYMSGLENLDSDGFIKRPLIPDNTTHNAHTFYLVVSNRKERDGLITFLTKRGIGAPFHFQSLHQSAYFKNQYKGQELRNADRYTDCLIRLPLYHGLKQDELEYVVDNVQEFFLN